MKTEEEELILKQENAKANQPYTSSEAKHLKYADVKNSSFLDKERQDIKKKTYSGLIIELKDSKKLETPLDEIERNNYEKYYSNYQQKSRNSEINTLKQVREWVEDVKKMTVDFLSGHLQRYNLLPPTSRAIFDNSGNFIFYCSKNSIVMREVKENSRETKVFTGHKEFVETLTLTSDNKELITGSKDNTIKVFNIESGKETRTLLGHTASVKSVAVSHTKGYILSGSKDTTMRWYDKEGVCLGVFEGHKKSVRAVAFSPNERIVISGSSDSTVRMYKLQPRSLLFIIPAHKEAIRALVFSPDSKMFLSGGKDQAMRLFNVEDGLELYKFNEAKGDVYSVGFSDDGTRVVSGSRDNNVIIYNIKLRECVVASGIKSSVKHVSFSKDSKKILCVCKDQSLKIVNTAGELKLSWNYSGIRSMCFSPNGNIIFSGEDDGSLSAYKTMSGEIIYKKLNILKKVLSLAISPCGTRILVGGSGGGINLVKSHTGETICKFNFHKKDVRSLAFSPDGQKFLSGSDDHSVKLVDIDTSIEEFCFTGHKDMVCSVAFSPNGKLFISSGSDKKIKLVDLFKREEIACLGSHSDVVRSVVFSHDGLHILSGSFDRTLKYFHAESGKEIITFYGHSDSVLTVALSTDDKYALSGGADNMIFLFDVKTAQVAQKFSAHSQEVRAVAFYPLGSLIASGGLDGQVKLFNISQKGGNKSYTRHTDVVRTLAISSDGKKIATAGDDKLIKIYSLETSLELLTLKGHTDWISCVAFSKDNRQIVSASGDKTIRTYNVLTGAVLLTVNAHDEWISSVTFSPDGNWILSGSMDKTVALFSSITGEKVQTYPNEQSNKNFINQEDDDDEPGSVRAVTFNSMGDKFLSGGDDKIVKLYICKTGEIIRKYKGHSNTILSIVCSNNDNFVASCGEDHFVKVYKMNNFETVWTFIGHEKGVNSVSISSDEKYVLSGGDDGSKFIVEIDTGILLKIFPNEEGSVYSVAFHPDGTKIASGGELKTARLFDVNTKGETQFAKNSFAVADICFSCDASVVAVSQGESSVLIYDAANGFYLKTLPTPPEDGQITAIKFSSNKDHLVMATSNEMITLFDIEENIIETKFLAENCKGVTALALSFDENLLFIGGKDGDLISYKKNSGTYIKARDIHRFQKKVLLIEYIHSEKEKKKKQTSNVFSCSEDGTAIIYSISEKKLMLEFVFSLSLVNIITLSFDKQLLAFVSSESSLKICSAIDGSEIQTIQSQKLEIVSLCFTSDGYRIVASFENNIVKIFDIETACELEAISFESKILRMACSPRIDTIVFGLENGLSFKHRVFNNNEFLAKFCEKSISDGEAENLEIYPVDLFMLPYPLKMTFLHYWIAYANDEISLLYSISRLFENKKKKEIAKMLSLIIFSKDSLQKTPWDYWHIYDFKEKRPLMINKLVDILTSQKITGIHKMKRKKKFLKDVLNTVPLRLPEVLDAFLKESRDIYLPRSSQENMPPFPSKTPEPSQFVLESLLKNNYALKGPVDNLVSYDLIISKIKPAEVLSLFDDWGSLEIWHPLFRSKALRVTIDFIWHSEIKEIFFINTVFYTIFLIIVCGQVLWLFPERNCGSINSRESLYEFISFILDIIIGLKIILILLKKHLVGCKLNSSASKSKNSGNRNQLPEGQLKSSKPAKTKISSAGSSSKANCSSGKLILAGIFLSLNFNTLIDSALIISGIGAPILDILTMKGFFKEYLDLVRTVTKYLFSILFITSWTRYSKFSRGFNSLSRHTRAFKSVLSDVGVYFLILFFLFAGVVGAVYVLRTDYDGDNFWDLFQKIYFLIHGDLSPFREIQYNLSDDFFFVLLLLISAFFTIFMFNFIVAFVWRTLDQASNFQKETAAFEKLQLINELRGGLSGIFLCSARRKKSRDVFLCKLETSEEIYRNSQMENTALNKIDWLLKSQNAGNNAFEELKNSFEQATKAQENLQANLADFKLEMLERLAKNEQQIHQYLENNMIEIKQLLRRKQQEY